MNQKVKEVTWEVILDTTRKLDQGRHPLRLRVTFDRTRKYYSLKIRLTEAEHERLMALERPRGEDKHIREQIGHWEDKAKQTIKALGENFTFEAFEKECFPKSAGIDRTDIIATMTARAAALKAEGRISTAINAECARNSLKEFTGKESLKFSEVTVKFLNEYEAYMTSVPGKLQSEVQLATKGKGRDPEELSRRRRAYGRKLAPAGRPGKVRSITTVGIYLREVRTVINAAIRDKVITSSPFGKDRYQIKASRNIKKALTLEEISRLYYYDPVGEAEAYNRDLWIFSYLCNGMNVSDIARLKFQNIDSESIQFIRHKTKRTTQADQAPVVVPLTAEVARIIDRHAQRPGRPEDYVFPILRPGMTPLQEYNAIQGAIGLINKYIGRIARECEISMKVTTYTARHSFATVLKRSGASVEMISDALGHHDTATTQSYLKGFEIAALRKAYGALTAFNNDTHLNQ